MTWSLVHPVDIFSTFLAKKEIASAKSESLAYSHLIRRVSSKRNEHKDLYFLDNEERESLAVDSCKIP
jgi:hypothetical protein